MTAHQPGLDLKILQELSEIPLNYQSRRVALREIAKLGKQALGSHVCSPVLVDLEKREVTLGAWAGTGESTDLLAESKLFRLGQRAVGFKLNYDVFAAGEMREFHDLTRDGQGVVNRR